MGVSMCGDDFQDLRAKIARRTHAVLLAKSAATGKDQSQLVREILAAWAEEEIHAATVMHRLLRSEGIAAADERHDSGVGAACQRRNGEKA